MDDIQLPLITIEVSHHTMSLSTIIILVGTTDAIFVVKRPWIGGIAGLIVSPLLLYTFIATTLLYFALALLFGFLIGFGNGNHMILPALNALNCCFLQVTPQDYNLWL